MRILLILLVISLIVTDYALAQEDTLLSEPNLIKNISRDYNKYLEGKLWLEWFPVYAELESAEQKGIEIPPLTKIKNFKIIKADLKSESIAMVEIKYVKAKILADGREGKPYVETKNEIFEHYKGMWMPKMVADYCRDHPEVVR